MFFERFIWHRINDVPTGAKNLVIVCACGKPLLANEKEVVRCCGQHVYAPRCAETLEKAIRVETLTRLFAEYVPVKRRPLFAPHQRIAGTRR